MWPRNPNTGETFFAAPACLLAARLALGRQYMVVVLMDCSSDNDPYSLIECALSTCALTVSIHIHTFTNLIHYSFLPLMCSAVT